MHSSTGREGDRPPGLYADEPEGFGQGKMPVSMGYEGIRGSGLRAGEVLDDTEKNSIIKLGNAEVRKWYLDAVSHIPDSIDHSLPIVEKAKKAFEARNRIRTEARDMMADGATRKRLDQERPNKSFEELIKSRMERKGLTREEAIEDICNTATKTNANVNKELGLEA